RWSVTSTVICAFSGWLGRGDGIILSTVPGMVVLGCSGIRVVSKFSSAILADLALRGFAISFLTLARVALCDSSLFLLFNMKLYEPMMASRAEAMQSHFAQFAKILNARSHGNALNRDRMATKIR